MQHWVKRAADRPRLMLVLFCLAAWLPGLFSLPPGDRDESRFAQATRQMTETGDYVRIMNGTEARNRKPIGIHWLQAPFVLAAQAAGIATRNPIWPYRLPSLFGGLLAVLATYQLGLAAGRRPALLAGAMLAASVLASVEVRIAKTDAALLGATTLAMAMLARAYLASAPGTPAPPAHAHGPDPATDPATDPAASIPRSAAPLGPGSAALFWLAIGAGVLLKGPVTPMVAGLCVLTLLALDHGRAGWLRGLRPAWGVLLLLAMVLPWFVAIGVATHGAFFAQALGGDLAGKLHGGDDAHGAWPGLHLLLLPLLAFPASPVILRALPELWRRRHDRLGRFLFAWVGPSWLVFELVPTKLPHYVLPLYPALCILAARWLLDPAANPAPRWLIVVSWTGFAAGAVALGVGGAALPWVLAAAVHGTPAQWWLGLPPLAAAATVAWLVTGAPGWRRDRAERAALPATHARLAGSLAAGLLAMPVLYATILGVELPRLAPLWIAPSAEAMLRTAWPGWNTKGRGLAVAGFAEPSLMFLAGTELHWLPASAAAASLGRGPDTAALVETRDVAAFEAALTHDSISAHAAGRVDGYNYSRGRRVALTLFVPGPDGVPVAR